MLANQTFCLVKGGVGSALRNVRQLPLPVLHELSPAERRVLVSRAVSPPGPFICPPMKTTPELASCLPDRAVESAPTATTWRLEILARAEPLALARVLQKISFPQIELLTARYDAGEARILLTLRGLPAPARLAAARIGRLVAIGDVVLTQAGET